LGGYGKMGAEQAILGNVLTKKEIEEALNNREIVVEPLLDYRQINSISIDLRLDNYFVRFEHTREGIIDPIEEHADYFKPIEVDFFKSHYILQPGDFVLAQTFEYIALPSNIVGILDGRSSIARRGITVHATASIVDPGFSGHLVFELTNNGTMPVKLYPLMRVAKIMFIRVKETAPYMGAYKYQVKIKPPQRDYDIDYIT
jgi:dCTP deaminase